MKEVQIAKNLYSKIENTMKKENITLTKLSSITGVSDSTLSSQLKNLKQGKFISIKALKIFEKSLKIPLIFFEK